MLGKFIIAAGLTVAAIAALMSFPAGARNATREMAAGAGYGYGYDIRPGWGYGDDNHEHTGPPGRMDREDRPGWGFGDDNHEHEGPPGLSPFFSTDDSSEDEDTASEEEAGAPVQSATGTESDGDAPVDASPQPTGNQAQPEATEEDVPSHPGAASAPIVDREDDDEGDDDDDSKIIKPGRGLGDPRSNHSGPPGQVRKKRDS